MITENEIRIGNWVNCETLDGLLPYKIGCISNGDAYCESDEYLEDAFSNAEISGIPLTEEWLLKAFDEVDDCEGEAITFYYSSHSGNDFRIVVDAVNEVIITLQMYAKPNWVTIPIDMTYVHTLQNGWFALCNKELTFGK